MTKDSKITSFNNYWKFFCKEAAERGYNQTEFMGICKLPKTRYNSFAKGSMNLTAYYVQKIMEGLRVTEKYIEEKSGQNFTDAQKKALQRITWSNNNQDIIDALMMSKALTKEFRDLILTKKK